jgi:hypothetical protein
MMSAGSGTCPREDWRELLRLSNVGIFLFGGRYARSRMQKRFSAMWSLRVTEDKVHATFLCTST